MGYPLRGHVGLARWRSLTDLGHAVTRGHLYCCMRLVVGASCPRRWRNNFAPLCAAPLARPRGHEPWPLPLYRYARGCPPLGLRVAFQLGSSELQILLEFASSFGLWSELRRRQSSRSTDLTSSPLLFVTDSASDGLKLVVGEILQAETENNHKESVIAGSPF